MQTLSRAAHVDFVMGALIWNEQRAWTVLLLLGKEHDDPSEGIGPRDYRVLHKPQQAVMS